MISKGLPLEHKEPKKILRDYCYSWLILSSDFSFLPITNRNYFLYISRGKFKLSPVSPKEWANKRFGNYLGKCRLKTDMTWTVVWSSDLNNFPGSVTGIRAHIRSFFEMVFQSDMITNDLPFCDYHLSYYKRLLAFGLSSSIELSLKKVDLHCLSGRDLLQSFGVELGSLYRYLLFRDEDHADLT